MLAGERILKIDKIVAINVLVNVIRVILENIECKLCMILRFRALPFLKFNSLVSKKYW